MKSPKHNIIQTQKMFKECLNSKNHETKQKCDDKNIEKCSKFKQAKSDNSVQIDKSTKLLDKIFLYSAIIQEVYLPVYSPEVVTPITGVKNASMEGAKWIPTATA